MGDSNGGSPSADSPAAAGDCVFFGCSDFSGLFRGRSCPASAHRERLATGCGWVPADQSLTPFGEIGPDNPFGPLGDLRLAPDPAAEYRCEPGSGASPLHFFVSDITELSGKPWECCARAWLKDGLQALRDDFGLGLRVAFEHEFTLVDDAHTPEPVFSLRAQRQEDALVRGVTKALGDAGIAVETVLPEYGERQFEVTLAPRPALRAADDAVALREIVREVARACGRRVSFSPKVRPDAVGNGAHIHFSLVDDKGKPLGSPAGLTGLSDGMGRFCAGVLSHIRAVTALAAPSVASYQRFGPHSWAAVFGCIGLRNREAALRICPTAQPGGDPAAGHHVELRVGDAASSPHLHLGALVHAGTIGLRRDPPVQRLVNTDPSAMPKNERKAHPQLPDSLEDALKALIEDRAFRSTASDLFWRCYLDMKSVEAQALEGLTKHEVTARYREVY